MRRLVIDALLFLSLQSVVFGVMVWAWPLRGRGYGASTIDKQWILRATSPPRIIFVGGSSLAFGVDSQMVRDCLGYEVVNMAVQGPLGDRYMTNEVEDQLAPGDIVVLGMENLLFAQPAGGSLVEQLLLNTTTGLRYMMDPAQVKIMLDSGLSGVHLLAIKTAHRLVDGPLLVGEVEGGAVARPNGSSALYSMCRYPLCPRCTSGPIYRRDSFNGYGDHVAHWGEPSVEFTFDHDLAAGFGLGIQRFAIERVNRFSNRCRDRGVTVAYVRPPVGIKFFNRWRRLVMPANAQLQRQLGVPILGEITDTVYQRRLLFDSPHHLTGEGVTLYTRHIIDHLGPLIPSRHQPRAIAGEGCPPQEVTLRGVESDGWTMVEATLCVYTPCAANEIELDVTCHTPAELLPVTVTARRQGVEVARLVLGHESRTGVLRIPISTNDEDDTFRGFGHYELTVDPTFAPAEWIPDSPDQRKLGVVVNLRR